MLQVHRHLPQGHSNRRMDRFGVSYLWDRVLFRCLHQSISLSEMPVSSCRTVIQVGCCLQGKRCVAHFIARTVEPQVCWRVRFKLLNFFSICWLAAGSFTKRSTLSTEANGSTENGFPPGDCPSPSPFPLLLAAEQVALPAKLQTINQLRRCISLITPD